VHWGRRRRSSSISNNGRKRRRMKRGLIRRFGCENNMQYSKLHLKWG